MDRERIATEVRRKRQLENDEKAAARRSMREVPARCKVIGTQVRLRMMMRKGDEAVRMRRELAAAPTWPTGVTEATAFARDAYLA